MEFYSSEGIAIQDQIEETLSLLKFKVAAFQRESIDNLYGHEDAVNKIRIDLMYKDDTLTSVVLDVNTKPRIGVDTIGVSTNTEIEKYYPDDDWEWV